MLRQAVGAGNFMYVIEAEDGRRVGIFPTHVASLETIPGREDSCTIVMVDGTRYVAKLKFEKVAARIVDMLKNNGAL